MRGRFSLRGAAPRAGSWLLWAVVLVMILWGLSPAGGQVPARGPFGAPSPAASTSGGKGAPGSAPTVPVSTAAAPPGLPGSSPKAPDVTPMSPALINQVRSSLWRIPQQPNQSELSGSSPHSGDPGVAHGGTPTPSSSLSSSSNTVKYLTGTFQGYVNSSGAGGSGISGVSIEAYSNGGGGTGPCPTNVCSPATSNATGFFSVVCPVGVDYILFTAAWYAQNLTYQTCVNNETVWAGTTYLLPDGIITGTVEADDAAHTPLAGVSVTGSTRDSVLVATPEVVTASNGSFTVPVPPSSASMVSFYPGSNYAANFTDVYAASGQTVSIGVVYMEPLVVVRAQFYDAITGAAIDGGSMAPLSLTVCSLLSHTCGNQGPPTTSGNTVRATGPPGNDYVLAEAPGYLLNQTDIGFASAAPGSTYCVPDNCRIYLIPEAGITLTVGLNTPTGYPTGLWYVTVSSMDGMQIGIPVLNMALYPYQTVYNTSVTTSLTNGCLGVGATVTVPAFPLRNDIKVVPDTTGVCGSGTPTWHIPGTACPENACPGDAPVYGNETWANATPDEATNVGTVNLIVGDYVFGTVGVTGGNASVPSGFFVTVASRESSTVATYPYIKGRSANNCGSGTSYSYTFCVPAPPGPDVITVGALGFPSNDTWISVPWGGFNQTNQPLPLWNATIDHVSMINLTVMANLNGSVTIAGGTAPIAFSALEVCPASSHAAISQCADGVANATGGFNVTAAPLGWVVITASASGFSPNSIWAYLSPGNNTVGTIPLTPLALVQGQVVSSNGTGLIDVSIDYCTVAAWSHGGACNSQLGSGITTSNGRYEGYLPGGWLPGATYTIIAQSSGYLSDWTLLNATANTTIVAPTLVLPQIGSSGNSSGGAPIAGRPAPSAAPRPLVPSTQATGSWVTGRIVDRTTGAGIVTAAIQACTAGNLTCVLFTPGTNSGGYFNGSVASGTYNLTISPSGYYPTTILLDANSGTSLNLGTIPLTPLPWVAGRTYINPWNTIQVFNPGTDANISILMGPPSEAQVCTTGLTFCSNAMPVDSGGFFMVQTIYSTYLTLTVAPTFAGGFTSGPGGFVRNSTIFNATAPQTNLTVPVPLDYFVAYMVTAYDNASYNASTGRFTQPAIWTSASISSRAGHGRNGQASGVTNGAGQIALFLAAGGPNTLSLTVGNPQMYFPVTVHNRQAVSLGTPNLTYTFPSANLTGFGWAVATIVNSITGLPAQGVGMAASFTTVSGLVVSTSGSANGGGYVNISAPVGLSVRFSLGGSGDYNNTTVVAAVKTGQTTYLNSTSGSGAIRLLPWGWVRSSELNYSTPGDYIGTIVDPVHDGAIAKASITVQSSDPAYGTTTAPPSNGLGEFMIDAPVGPADYLQVSAEGYLTNTTAPFGVLPGEMTVFPTINLTGDGVLAGRVIGEPSGLPVAGAMVTICPANSTFSPECVTVTTNLSGIYWAATPPGLVGITVAAVNYVGNYTEDVTVHSDQYFMAPTYEMQEYGLVTGSVIGLPIGLSIPNASVSLCSPIGVPTGPCSFQYDTTPNGSFSLSVPAAQYVVVVSFPYYNSTYLPISLRPGEVLSLGSLFIQEYGILLGRVQNAVTGAPVVNAVVSGCPVLLWMSCDVPVRTTATGLYRLSASSGTVDASVAAAGYQTGFAKYSVASGATRSVPTMDLIPVNQEVTYPVSGVVNRLNGTRPVGVSGATVTFKVGNVSAYSTTTNSLGRYQVQVLAGSYEVVFALPGFLPVVANLSVTEAVVHFDATLMPFLYLFQGQTIDGLIGTVLSNVSIVESSLTGSATTSGPDGQFGIELANGTYVFTASASNSSTLYAPTVFQIVVSGASVARTVRLYPPSSTLGLELRSGGTGGGPLANGSVLIYGTAVDGAAVSYSGRGDALGSFAVSVYYGQYTVVVEAPGFYSVSPNVTLAAPVAALNLTLTPVPSPSGSSSGVWIAAGLGISAAAVAVLGVLVWGRKI